MKTVFTLKRYPSIREEKTFPEEMLQEGYRTGSIETNRYYIYTPSKLPGKELSFYEWLCLYNLEVA